MLDITSDFFIAGDYRKTGLATWRWWVWLSGSVGLVLESRITKEESEDWEEGVDMGRVPEGPTINDKNKLMKSYILSARGPNTKT
jgi:hypothetical protein